MGLIIIRIFFVCVAIGLGVYFFQAIDAESQWMPWMILGGTTFAAIGVITADVAIKNKRVDTISAVYFGLVVGLFITYVAKFALTPVLMMIETDQIRETVIILLGAFFCYICISVLWQTKNDFRFIIPYVEFSKDVKGQRSLILDTSVVIDGRIYDLVEAKLFDGSLIMPKFVIAELQAIADSNDRMRRSRGRRGLDILNRLRSNPDVDLQIYDRKLPEFANQTVDMKLVILAQHLSGKLVTNDYNLNKIAQLHGVEVVNLNDVANAMKPIFLPGEHIEVKVVKTGEEAGQGIAYLEDGTMVVVEGGRGHVGRTVPVTVTSVLQTSAGRMVFTKVDPE